MKIDCHCGACLHDAVDVLAIVVRGKEIPRDVIKEIDGIVLDVAEGRRRQYDAARMIEHAIESTFVDRIYSCRECGRICMDDEEGKLTWFSPEPTSKVVEI